MQSKAFNSSLPSSHSPQPLKRRGLIFGAGAAGAAAVAAAALPLAPTPIAMPSAASAGVSEKGGYQVTAHVLRYYQTTRI